MAKSVGNVFGCDAIADAVGGEALRFFCVSHHYRSPVEFEVQKVTGHDGAPVMRFYSLEAADRRLAYFYETLARIDQFGAAGEGGERAVLPEAEILVTAAREALADDFNAPVVMAALGEAARIANKLLDEGKGIDKQVRRRSLARLGRDVREVGVALGILASAPSDYLRARRARLVPATGIDPTAIDRLMAERTAARAGKDFARADAIRGELAAIGVELLDTPAGTDWRVLEASA